MSAHLQNLTALSKGEVFLFPLDSSWVFVWSQIFEKFAAFVKFFFKLNMEPDWMVVRS
jgi:hypothetical protein